MIKTENLTNVMNREWLQLEQLTTQIRGSQQNHMDFIGKKCKR